MGMAAILFNGAEPFEQISTSLRQKVPCEIWRKWVARFQRRRLKISWFYTSGGGGVCVCGWVGGAKLWSYVKSFTILITHCKFQPLVLNTCWKKNDFSTFSPYKSIETQTWPCRFFFFFFFFFVSFCQTTLLCPKGNGLEACKAAIGTFLLTTHRLISLSVPILNILFSIYCAVSTETQYSL